jgi:glycosyltransferase involved in cell wall biosynthesis
MVRFGKKRRIALMLNILAPYRIPLVRRLADNFWLRLMLSGEERNRAVWDEHIRSKLAELQIESERVWGLTFAIPRLFKGKLFDHRYVHINPGYLRALLRFRPDGVITNEMGFRSAVAVLYGYLFRKPVWVWWGGTLHTERAIGPIKRLWRKIFAKVVRRWISYGCTSTEYLLSLGVPRERILQIQNCVDERLFVEQHSPALQIEPKPVLLYVGQLIKRKGVDLLLIAAAKVQAKGHQFSLLIVGSGPEQANLESLAKQLGLKNVLFLKERVPSEMPGIYRSADVLVFPTLEDVWGLVVNEALWSGLPALVSKYAGCAPELVPETNVFDPLWPEDFEAALERAVRREIAPPDLCRLIPCEKVAEMLILDIKAELGDS